MSYNRKDHKSVDSAANKAFKQLFDDNVKDLYLICYSHITDKEICQEIVHDVFRSIWERRDNLKLDSTLTNYLRRAVKLKTIDHIRKKKSIKNSRELLMGQVPDKIGNNNIENRIHLNELEDKVKHLVNLMPPKRKQIFKLSRENGLSHNEIAAKLLISPNTVKSQLNKALADLKAEIFQFAYS